VDRARLRGAVVLFGVGAFAFVADRLTKVWAESRLADGPIEVIPGVLTFRFTTNSGGAFSIGGSAPWIFVTASVLVIGVIVVTAFRHTSVVSALAAGLILGGALGNLTDRAIRGDGFRGRVVDFIDLHVWPIFNLADTAIVIGAILLALGSFLDGRRDAPGGADEGSGPSDEPHPRDPEPADAR
jgi:signal peptidase II